MNRKSASPLPKRSFVQPSFSTPSSSPYPVICLPFQQLPLIFLQKLISPLACFIISPSHGKQFVRLAWLLRLRAVCVRARWVSSYKLFFYFFLRSYLYIVKTTFYTRDFWTQTCRIKLNLSRNTPAVRSFWPKKKSDFSPSHFFCILITSNSLFCVSFHLFQSDEVYFLESPHCVDIKSSHPSFFHICCFQILA